jgi:LDH2 family malate/lactate/ureidoglycolate dehydrogenase
MPIVDAKKLAPLMEQAFAQIGMCEASRELAVASMVETSLRGVDSHGINLFPHYHAAAQSARIQPRPSLEVVSRRSASAVLDGDHAIGHHAGSVAIDLACELADASGVGAVAVRHSTHFGAAGFFALRAARRDQYIGLSFTNADSLVKAFGSKSAFFGTNPICLAAPMSGEDPLCIDLATSTVSWNKVKNHRRSGEALTPGWAFDQHGEPTTDAHAARMLETIGGYKGFALGLMVELLCGLLADGPVATELLPMFASPLTERRNISHFFMALRIDAFVEVERFTTRLTEMARAIRGLGARDGQVMAPGDPEKRAFVERSSSGIPMFDDIFEQYLRISPRFSETRIS